MIPLQGKLWRNGSFSRLRDFKFMGIAFAIFMNKVIQVRASRMQYTVNSLINAPGVMTSP